MRGREHGDKAPALELRRVSAWGSETPENTAVTVFGFPPQRMNPLLNSGRVDDFRTAAATCRGQAELLLKP